MTSLLNVVSFVLYFKKHLQAICVYSKVFSDHHYFFDFPGSVSLIFAIFTWFFFFFVDLMFLFHPWKFQYAAMDLYSRCCCYDCLYHLDLNTSHTWSSLYSCDSFSLTLFFLLYCRGLIIHTLSQCVLCYHYYFMLLSNLSLCNSFLLLCFPWYCCRFTSIFTILQRILIIHNQSTCFLLSSLFHVTLKSLSNYFFPFFLWYWWHSTSIFTVLKGLL